MTVQRLPWAAGKQKAAAPTPRKRRRRRRMSRRGLMTTLAWELSALSFMCAALIMQAVLLAVIGVLSALVGALAGWADTHRDGAVPAPNAACPKSAKPPGNARSGGKRGQPGTAVPNCTRTGQPIDRCGCSVRHVASEAGVRRYKQAKRVGDPISGGSKVSTAKQPRVPATNNAKPIPVGEPMRRAL